MQAVLEAAARVFSERGYASTTTNHIAERAGVSIGSLYQYFPNKDSILAALCEKHDESASKTLGEVLEQAVCRKEGVRQLLARFVAAVLRMHAADPGLQHVFLFEAPRTSDTTERLHRVEDRLARALTSVLSSRHGVSVRHARHAAYIIVHVVETLVHEFVVHPPQDMDREVFVQEVVALLHAYVRGPCVNAPEPEPA